MDKDVDFEAPGEDEEEPAKRHVTRGGTRTDIGRVLIYEGEWFYMTKHAFFNDVKMNIKGKVCKPLQMGTRWATKALTPASFDESPLKFPVTRALLLAWGVWRCQRFGWAMETASRRRTLADMWAECAREVRAADGRAEITAPVFGNREAHNKLVAWAPTVVKAVVAGC